MGTVLKWKDVALSPLGSQIPIGSGNSYSIHWRLYRICIPYSIKNSVATDLKWAYGLWCDYNTMLASLVIVQIKGCIWFLRPPEIMFRTFCRTCCRDSIRYLKPHGFQRRGKKASLWWAAYTLRWWCQSTQSAPETGRVDLHGVVQLESRTRAVPVVGRPQRDFPE